MPSLKEILTLVPIKVLHGDAEVRVPELCLDSRMVTQGSAFIAIRGFSSDGHHFIEKAISRGALIIICEQMPTELREYVTYVQVGNTSEAAGLMASAFYSNPSMELKIVGVTGTNGKTTVATILFRLFSQLGYKCGLISTVQNHIHDLILPSTHTTPDAISVQALLRRMADEGCSHVFMEVSSHAIHQERIRGIEFAGAVFTNITHDHLDYHQTFEEYIRVKKKFFDDLSSSAFALVNADDKRGAVMMQNTRAAKNAFSLKIPASFKGRVLENNLSGLVMVIDNLEAHFRLTGLFNAYNLLAVYGVAVLMGEDRLKTLAVLSDIHGAPGRFETVLSEKEKVLGIVDYAHTPDALINVLATINQLRTKGQNLITVLGCGGDRDKTKRPVMAQVACTHSDKAILTSDNPRNEDAEEILNDMESGLTSAHKRKMLRITDRKEAIKTACALAQAEDIVLVAGKGHETYQEIRGVKYPFDDKEILVQTFELLGK